MTFKLRFKFFLIAWMIFFCAILSTNAKNIIYVSPSGNDTNSGSKLHPYASLEQALRQVRKLTTHNKGDAYAIYLREGVYDIRKTIEPGELNGPVRISGYKDEKVIFSGGIRLPVNVITTLSHVERTESGLSANVRKVDLHNQGVRDYGQIRNVGFARPYGNAWAEIFVNKKPMHLSRWPNKGMIPMGKVLDAGSIPRQDDFSDKGGIMKYDSTRIDHWAKEKDAWMAGYFMWGYADDMVKIASINTKKKTIETASSTLYGYGSDKPWRNWYGVNILAELDAAGEYYIDREKGMLYFISDEEQIESLDFSILEDPFFTLQAVQNITIEGITFECSRGMGIAMVNTQNVTIKGCTFRNLGSLGITVGKGIEPFADYCHEGSGKASAGIVGSLQQHIYANTIFNREGGKNNKIIGCEFYQLGAGGVSLGGGDRITLESGNNVVENCVFHDLNRIEKSYRPAVHLTGVGNKVVHCEIYNTPSMAIYMYGNDHLLEYNYMHDVCLEVEDQGAVYYGRDPSERGSVIRYNYFENIPDHFSTCAIYHDDGACGLTVTQNIFYKAGKWNVLMGGGSDNVYINNIFIGNQMGFHIDNRLQNWSKWLLDKGNLFEKRLKAVNYQKPPYSQQYPKLLTYFETAAVPTGNLVENNVFVEVGQVLDGKKEWLHYKESNWETDQDVKFADEENRNFTLSSKSAIYKKIPEFQEIPFHKIGLYKTDDFPTILKKNGLRVGVNEE